VPAGWLENSLRKVVAIFTGSGTLLSMMNITVHTGTKTFRHITVGDNRGDYVIKRFRPEGDWSVYYKNHWVGSGPIRLIRCIVTDWLKETYGLGKA
jgi:hypothetical protein